MQLSIYKLNNNDIEYTDNNGNEYTSSLAFVVESQMIEYFNNDDKLEIVDLYKQRYKSDLVVETGLWGGVSIYKTSNVSYLSMLRCLFYMCMFISVLLAPREITILGMKQPGGILFFCLSFLFIDTICQSYGYLAARKTLLINAVLMFISGGLIYATSLFPAVSNDTDYQKVVFDGMVKLCFINGICSLIADQINAKIFQKIKFLTMNRSLWLRSILSTLVSQFFFTVFWISFFKFDNLFKFETYLFILSNFQMKVIFALALIPLLYYTTWFLSKRIKF
ncbi:putative preQ0 transporter [Vibrio ichthyoenteri ATCC 700023]|uniref:Putative preQ0 transporter n=1 Tax=Vibrio ichthyoenteri ATCC 700023 TaxID=870968 RepID=F9S7U6_9VIBR|nr:VUT family protein [Vibrio ichthyoenteri]EGU30996.1 putative preQ0 transporter [Vibrio ichthyoenteri ATCC 700023]